MRLLPATVQDLSDARAVLSRFDAVVIVESFDADAKLRLIDALGLAGLISSVNDETIHENVNHKLHTDQAAAMRAPPADLRSVLLEDLWLDLLLYCWAVRREEEAGGNRGGKKASLSSCAVSVRAAHGQPLREPPRNVKEAVAACGRGGRREWQRKIIRQRTGQRQMV